jgi:hypothetical protein
MRTPGSREQLALISAGTGIFYFWSGCKIEKVCM